MPDDTARSTHVSPPAGLADEAVPVAPVVAIADRGAEASEAPVAEGNSLPGAVESPAPAALGSGERERDEAVALVGAAASRELATTAPPPTGLRVAAARDLRSRPDAPADLSAEGPMWTFRQTGAVTDDLPPVTDDNQAELPFAVTGLAKAPEPRRHPMFGPVGRDRSALLVPLLAVVTLGVYALVWHHRTTRELELFDPKLRVRPGRSTLALTLPWLAGLLVTLGGAAALGAHRLSLTIPFGIHVSSAQAYALLGGLAAVPYLVLLLPFSIVAVVMMLERIRCVEEHIGATTDRQVRPVASVLLLAVPLLGGLVLLGTEQRRINAIWDAVAPADGAAAERRGPPATPASPQPRDGSAAGSVARRRGDRGTERLPARRRRSVLRSPSFVDRVDLPDDADGRVLIFAVDDGDDVPPPGGAPRPSAAGSMAGHLAGALLDSRFAVIVFAVVLVVLLVLGMVLTR